MSEVTGSAIFSIPYLKAGPHNADLADKKAKATSITAASLRLVYPIPGQPQQHTALFELRIPTREGHSRSGTGSGRSVVKGWRDKQRCMLERLYVCIAGGCGWINPYL